MKKSSSHKIVVTSTNRADTPVDLEEKLQKAVTAMKLQQESRELPDTFLKTEHHTTATLVDQVIESMLSEVAEVLTGGEDKT